jgi:hypothetical protein
MGYLYETCDQISDFCHQVAEKNILEGRTDRQTVVKQYTPLPNFNFIWFFPKKKIPILNLEETNLAGQEREKNIPT